MKTYTLSILKHFSSPAGVSSIETLYTKNIINGTKKHQISTKMEYWEPKLEAINRKEGKLIVREYQGLPFRSTFKDITILYSVNYEPLSKLNGSWLISNTNLSINENTLSKNEGLTLYQLNTLYPEQNYKNLLLIHFSKFTYMDINDRIYLKRTNYEKQLELFTDFIEPLNMIKNINISVDKHYLR
jgi:hypothetical protein